MIFYKLTSCVPFEDDIKEISITESSVNEILKKYDFQLEDIRTNESSGIKIVSLAELESVIQVLKEKKLDETVLRNVLDRNNLESIPIIKSSEASFFIEDRLKTQEFKIRCLENWRNVYGRIGISSQTYIDISFQTGNGDGLISNFDASLGGLTFMTALGKNTFNNEQYASSSNNYQYSGIYTYSIRYVLFVEGVGDIWTSEIRNVRIRVDGCTGQVSYTEIIP
ncbi:hypothetical protein SAMN04488104_100442 [Algoriphagus faecimaris]|uniref:Uncharacterized protein n=1 Tax=Algoriphagus faecimaris TaxID=686796 RepID=A0A1G6NTM1_9BACT|nr:hypothetical protein SAMN04488104_100442 [Algoriphagus faecimaris]